MSAPGVRSGAREGLPASLRYRHIAVEGPIGVGKSTFARLLARETGARFVADPDASNPYLAAFYADPGSNALHAQLHFLVRAWRRSTIRPCDARPRRWQSPTS